MIASRSRPTTCCVPRAWRLIRAAARPAGGAAALWLKADDAQALHDKLAPPGSGSSPPRRRAVRPAVDPEGFLITVHDLA
jgi:hypothetical protein